MKVALDSQTYTYLISALDGLTKPTGVLAEQQIALVRTLFYSSPLFISETVRGEYLRIRDMEKLGLHSSWSVLFPEINTIATHSAVMRRTHSLLAAHRKLADCQIVAECEQCGIEVLLTYDRDLLARLNSVTSINIVTPFDHWDSLAIPRGALPITIPAPSNPLGDQTWWIW